MLLNLLSQSNYGRYNFKLAEVLGLNAAVYLEELLDINDKAIRKDKIRKEMEDSSPAEEQLSATYFTVDREYIQKRTTLTPSVQIKLDEKLFKCGVLKKQLDADSTLAIDVFAIADLVSSDSSKLKKSLHNSSNGAKKLTKKQAIAENLKSKIDIENAELRNAYFVWIDSIMESGRPLSAQAIMIFQKEIDRFSNRYLDVALELLSIAALKVWKDPHYVVNEYKQRHGITGDTVAFEKKF